MCYVTHVSTSSELQIASTLPKERAKIFLATRYYIREALSALFNISPINIPIIAPPGKPPKLPNGMGYISISHCKDAFIIVWHQDKIGVDIERSDRHFNYQKLAQKYFRQEKMNPYSLNKYSILKEWSAIEAAIKCERGTLSKDIKEWNYQKGEEILYHKTKKIKLNLIQVPLLNWTISIAYKNNISNNIPIIICNNL